MLSKVTNNCSQVFLVIIIFKMHCVTFTFSALLYFSVVHCEPHISYSSHSMDAGYNIDEILHQARLVQRQSDINVDFAELLNLLPKSKIQSIFNTYIHQDPEVASNWAYIHTSEFQNLLGRVVGSKDFQKVSNSIISFHIFG